MKHLFLLARVPASVVPPFGMQVHSWKATVPPRMPETGCATSLNIRVPGYQGTTGSCVCMLKYGNSSTSQRMKLVR